MLHHFFTLQVINGRIQGKSVNGLLPILYGWPNKTPKAYTKLFMIESKVGWTFPPPRAGIQHLPLLKTGLDFYEMAAVSSIKAFLRFNPILGDYRTLCDILFDWETLGKSKRCLRLVNKHR